jgi:hypothetical protein
MAMSPFLGAFLPNLAATILGVILGLPVALYVNRRLTQHQQALEKAQSIERRNDAVKVLIGDLQFNDQLFDKVLALAPKCEAHRYLDLRTTTWESVRHWFIPLCPHPDLLQALAHHWLRLHHLQELNRELFLRAVGAEPPIDDLEVVAGMWWELRELTLSLRAHSSQLAAALKELAEDKPQIALRSDPNSFLPEHVLTLARGTVVSAKPSQQASAL